MGRARCCAELAKQINMASLSRFSDMPNNAVLLSGIAGARGILVASYLDLLGARATYHSSHAVLLDAGGMRLADGTIPDTLLVYPAVGVAEVKAAAQKLRDERRAATKADAGER
jgi:hypothetical protein